MYRVDNVDELLDCKKYNFFLGVTCTLSTVVENGSRKPQVGLTDLEMRALVRQPYLSSGPTFWRNLTMTLTDRGQGRLGSMLLGFYELLVFPIWASICT